MQISASENKVTLDKVGASTSSDKEIATATETVLDQEFIEKYNNDWCWVGNKNIPTEMGWYKVEREKQQLEKISYDEAAKLAWHERLFIYTSALIAAKEDSHLALYIGGEHKDGRLSALYLCGPDYLAWVAER